MASWALPSITWDVSPIAFQFGPVAVRGYQLCLHGAIFLGMRLLAWQAARGGGDAEDAGDFLAYGLLGGLCGGRLGQALFYDWDRSLDDPISVLQVWRGGLSGHGAVLGLALALYWFARRRSLPFLELADRAAFSVAAFAALNRLGNLWNSELVGRLTDQSWGMRFPLSPGEAQPAPLRYPVQIGQMLLGVAVLGLLWWCDAAWGRERRPRGALTGVLLVSYFTGRIFVEHWSDPLELGGTAWLLTTSQWLSIPAAVLGAFVLVRALSRQETAGWVVASPLDERQEPAFASAPGAEVRPEYAPPGTRDLNERE